ncbi:hypothetical protein ACTQZS_14120 [Bilifractor sp. LCP19S3_H10]|uniref:hypothetical protein n=1 Tax=Bilifractor sp. LCP19S3_H10 TaxID=3438736 RepID=UPI003F9189DC
MEKRKRMSLDMSAEQYDLLEKASRDAGTTNGRYILFLIQQFLDLPDSVRHSLFKFCASRAQEAVSMAKESSGFQQEEWKQSAASYRNLAFFFQKDEAFESAGSMHAIQLKNGTLLIPNNWLILDNADPKKCQYAGVVEVQNGDRYNIPHAVFFTNSKYGKDYSKDFIRSITDLCRKKIPTFADMEKDIVQPQRENGSYGPLLNAEKYLASPKIGFFNIPVEGDPVYFSVRNYEPPYGAIIRITK